MLTNLFEEDGKKKRVKTVVIDQVIESVATNDGERAMLRRFLRGISWQSPENLERLSMAAAKVADEFRRISGGGVLIIALADGRQSWANPSLAVQRVMENTHRLATVDEVCAAEAARFTDLPAHS